LPVPPPPPPPPRSEPMRYLGAHMCPMYISMTLDWSRQAETLTQNLNDLGRLGHLTRYLAQQQLRQASSPEPPCTLRVGEAKWRQGRCTRAAKRQRANANPQRPARAPGYTFDPGVAVG